MKKIYRNLISMNRILDDIGKKEFSDAQIEHVVSTAWRIYDGHIGKIRHMTYEDCLQLIKSGREPI